MSEREKDLVTDEGVDEGSADMSAEAAGLGHGDVDGPHVTPHPDHDAGPVPVETPESVRAHDGQQLEAGEG
jgi:hypothetical protein